MKERLCILTPKHWSAMMGGSQYQIKCLLEKLVPAGKFEIYYITKKYNHQYIPCGYNIISLTGHTRFTGNRYYFDSFSLLKNLNKIKPAIIYQRVGCAYTGIAAFYAKRNNCKMVWHIAHDTDVMPGKVNKSLKFRQGCLEKKILEYGLKNCSAIIAQTHQQKIYLKKYYKRKTAAVIPNFQPRPEGEIHKDNSIIILWVANLKQWKKPESFIRLAEDLSRMNLAVECFMIGKPSGNKPWQEALEKRIAEISILSYLGACSIEEVNSFLNRAHIFINTSTAEGFPNTFIQAWMRKTPVVSLHCNPDNIFCKHKVGFFSGKYDKMLSQVVKLIKNNTLREEMGEAARAYALQTHSLDNLKAIEKILNEN